MGTAPSVPIDPRTTPAGGKQYHPPRYVPVNGTQFVFASSRMLHILDTITAVAAAGSPVLILGERGTGKRTLARIIHEKSGFAGKPFVTVNCSALPRDLMEVELFGCRKGAIGQVLIDCPGKFQFAHGGTIFLEGLVELSPPVQARLLRFLQAGTYVRPGAGRETRVNVRLIAASHRNLAEAAEKGTLRADLYHRLSAVRIEVPSLRKRREDISVLCAHFLKEFSSRYKTRLAALPGSIEKLLCSYDWPGNVCELREMIKRYAALPNPDRFRQELESRMTLCPSG